MKTRIILLIILLFTQIQSTLYLSIYIDSVDDCVYQISNNSNIYYKFNIDNILIECYYSWFYYPNEGKPIIMNEV